MDAAVLDAELDEWLWPESWPELRQMENALRCQICGDFFHGPVLLSCTHTFCSECVRRFLQARASNGCCPECKQPCAPSDLVPNRTLEKVGVLFQQMKPKVLPILGKAKVSSAAAAAKTSTESTPLESGKPGGDGRPPERMALLSYNVMKEKDIKKLLESIGIRLQVKNREDIIQIHKEYVLLANAQADSSHPKSAKQIREEVVRNYRARQAEKQFSSGGLGSGGSRKSLDAGQAPAISTEMQAGFARLQQQVKARQAQLKAKQEDKEGGDENATLHADDRDDNDGDDDDPRSHGAGDRRDAWRHVHAVTANVEFYIHSRTHEIRMEPPREFLEQQQERLKEHNERASHETTNGEGGDDEDEPVVVVGTRSASSSQADKTTVASAQQEEDDDDDFEVVALTSPLPKLPLGSRNSTPLSQSQLQSQSQSASARKRAERRRSSVGSTASNGSVSGSSGVAAFFSQETVYSIQATSTQHAPSASASLLSFTSQSGNSARPADASSPEPSDSQAQPLTETRWECPRCTLVNETVGANAECEACGHQHRPARKKQKLQFQSKLFPPP